MIRAGSLCTVTVSNFLLVPTAQPDLLLVWPDTECSHPSRSTMGTRQSPAMTLSTPAQHWHQMFRE